jgi:hypothetical protein
MEENEQEKTTKQKLVDLQAEVERLKEQMEELHPSCSFIGMKQDELRHMIENLRPDREMYAGKKFLLALLDSQGVDGVETFTNKALKALSEGDGLDIPHHFNVVEKEIFKKAALHIWKRREFLTTFAWSIPGAVLMVKTPFDIAALTKRMEKSSSQEADENNFDKAHHVVENISLITEIPLAAALIYEGIRHDREMRLEHIADAVTELADRIQQESRNKKNQKSGR